MNTIHALLGAAVVTAGVIIVRGNLASRPPNLSVEPTLTNNSLPTQFKDQSVRAKDASDKPSLGGRNQIKEGLTSKAKDPDSMQASASKQRGQENFNYLGSLIADNFNAMKALALSNVTQSFENGRSLSSYPELLPRIKALNRGVVATRGKGLIYVEISVLNPKELRVTLKGEDGFLYGELQAQGSFDDDIRVSDSSSILIDPSSEGDEFIQIFLSKDDNAMRGFYYRIDAETKQQKIIGLIRPI